MAENILIYRLGSLGDTIIVLPCFHKIRESFPGAKCTLLTNKPVAAKAAALESILPQGYFYSDVISYPVGTRNLFTLLKLVLNIRRKKIDTVINLTAARSEAATSRDKFFFRLAGVKNLIGFPSTQEDYSPTIDPVSGLMKWEAYRIANRIKKLGEIDFTQDRYWDLKLTKAESEAAEKMIGGLQPFIAISAGTKMQSKDWEVNNWTGLVRQLKMIYPDYYLVLVGAPDEFETAEVCALAWGKNAVNVCGKTSPRVSAAILKKAAVFIGHDSGPMHLAACMGTPCVAVFSARNIPMRWFPRGENNRILYHKTDCAGCNLEVCIEQKKKCILSITIPEVINEVTRVLKPSVALNIPQ